MSSTDDAKGTCSADFRDDEYPHKDITERIIACGIRVHRELHAGFVEDIYERALCHEMGKSNLKYVCQKVLPVHYDRAVVGEHRADVIVEDAVVVELKAVSELTNQHMSQLMSTMKAAGAKVGLLMNFGQARLVDGVRRVVM